MPLPVNHKTSLYTKPEHHVVPSDQGRSQCAPNFSGLRKDTVHPICSPLRYVEDALDIECRNSRRGHDGEQNGKIYSIQNRPQIYREKLIFICRRCGSIRRRKEPLIALPTWSPRVQSCYPDCTWQILGLVHYVGTAGMTPVGMTRARAIASDTVKAKLPLSRRLLIIEKSD
jgi:hypothetical protein